MKDRTSDLEPCCPPCCRPIEPDVPAEPETPEEPPVLGPSVVDSPVPLSNGLNIPTLGILRGYKRYYTRCTYVNQGEMPAPPEIEPQLQVGEVDDLEFEYYEQPSRRIDVVSYPTPHLVFPDAKNVEVDGNITRAYPTSDPTYYFEFEYVIDDIQNYITYAHYNVNVAGYDSVAAVGTRFLFLIKAASLEVPAHIVMPEPYMEISNGYVFLSNANANSEDIYLKSNVAWAFDFTR